MTPSAENELYGTVFCLNNNSTLLFDESVLKPSGLKFDPSNKNIYFIQRPNFFSRLDINDINNISLYSYELPNEFIYDFEFSPYTNKVYASLQSGTVKIFDCTQQEFLNSSINECGMLSSLKYNPVTHNIYILSPFNPTNKFHMEMLIFNEDNYLFNKVYFSQNESLRPPFLLYTLVDIILNDLDNKYIRIALTVM